jgi:hypothetical protein
MQLDVLISQPHPHHTNAHAEDPLQVFVLLARDLFGRHLGKRQHLHVEAHSTVHVRNRHGDGIHRLHECRRFWLSPERPHRRNGKEQPGKRRQGAGASELRCMLHRLCHCHLLRLFLPAFILDGGHAQSLEQVIADSQRVGHDCQRRIHSPARRKEARIHYIQVVELMRFAVAIER